MTAWWLRLVPFSWRTEPLTPDGKPASAAPTVQFSREHHAGSGPEAHHEPEAGDG